jgi:endonuclease IV
MIIGYAICDIENKNQKIESAIKHLPANAIEFQRELNIWDVPLLRRIAKNYEFISVHAPTRYVDLSSSNDGMQKRATKKTTESMDIAHDINANLLVLHPVHPAHYEGWSEPRRRHQRRQQFIETFHSAIVPHYIDNSHSYRIAIENIEYSKYPATLEETLELNITLNSMHPVEIVLDIPHIWNSRRMLAENNNLKDKVFGYPWTPEVLHDYVEKFIRHNHDRIAMYHVADFGDNPIRTHDPISKKTIHPELKDSCTIPERQAYYPRNIRP